MREFFPFVITFLLYACEPADSIEYGSFILKGIYPISHSTEYGPDFNTSKFIFSNDTLGSYIGWHPQLPRALDNYIRPIHDIIKPDLSYIQEDSITFIGRFEEVSIESKHEMKETILLKKDTDFAKYTTYLLRRDEFDIWLAAANATPNHSNKGFLTQAVLTNSHNYTFVHFWFYNKSIKDSTELFQFIDQIELNENIF